MPKGLAVGIATIAALVLMAAPSAAAPNGKLKLTTLSTEPEHVTGGDVLVAVDVSGGADPAKVRVRAGGRDVTGSFAPRAGDPDRLVGLVGGLPRGDTLLSANGPGVRRPASLGIFNSPITGPVFSGPHQSPFYCRTEQAGLGPATDDDCSAATNVAYLYRRNDDTWQPLADPAAPYPADGVRTTTRDGRTVDYVVRLETGVIDRSIYRFAILAPGGDPGGGWNRRFVLNFGGGCGAGYQQGTRPQGSVLKNRELAEGYAVLSGSLNVFGTACNDVLSAEAAQMLKEHAIEELGEKPAWTMGQGGSGGSVQQQMIAQNYPGILDGIMPGASFPDGAGPDYPDCRLLNAYYATPDGAALSSAQRVSISGLANPDGCLALGQGADVVNASEGCDEGVVPVAVIFDPVTNPDGVRCTVWDSMIAVYGVDPDTGHARRTLDNVGVQYGLEALNDGDIDAGEFLDLNEGIGGYDDDGELRPARSMADPQARRIAFESGRVNATAGAYTHIPTLDIRTYVDEEVNVHQYANTYRTRARLDALHGDHDTQVMWRAKGGSSVSAMNDAALETLAGWMDAIANDTSGRSAVEKVVANKPADAVDACWINGVRHDGTAAIGADNLCETTYPPHSLPANRAGKPLGSQTLKCRLAAIDYGDYDVAFSPAQRSRLESIFPGGVCDWSRPGVGEAGFGGTGQEFGPDRDVKKRKRTIGLSVRGVGRGRSVLRARLGPCPATTWQRVRFEERQRRGGWRRIGSSPATGRKCRAALRLRVKRRSRARVRAVAPAAYGYRAARSKPKRP
ncbi:MAG: hypothetical protein KDB46_03845 [Solirubrobacterales bacterium]|nr:hypothetical protein [Solirubrobacterales bacterium]